MNFKLEIQNFEDVVEKLKFEIKFGSFFSEATDKITRELHEDLLQDLTVKMLKRRDMKYMTALDILRST